MEIKDRIKLIIEGEEMTAGAFADAIGVAQATISHILGPRNKYPSTEVIMRLHNRFPNINLNWLYTGEGSMMVHDSGNHDDGKDYSPSYELSKPLSSDINLNKNMDTNVRNDINVSPLTNNMTERKRTIVEIRVFFDDNTFETFKP